MAIFDAGVIEHSLRTVFCIEEELGTDFKKVIEIYITENIYLY